MKVPYVIAVAALLTTALLVSSVAAGNGAPNGAHYNLNIIGVKKADRNMPDLSSGKVIFVGLGGKISAVTTKIYLFPGPFDVLDKDGTDGRAEFQLPVPSSECYQVYARALGKPGGKANITTCYENVTLGETYCSVNNLWLNRTKGRQGFGDVTDYLTEVCFWNDATLDLTDQICRDIFSEEYYDYFWNYDNYGLKLAQLRFYPCD